MKEKMFEFTGVSMEWVKDLDVLKKEEDKWVEMINDSGHALYITKDDFNHTEEGLEFDYRYVLSVNSYHNEETHSEVDDAVIDLVLIVSPKSLSKDKYNTLVGNYEWTDETDLNRMYSDMYYDGSYINIGYKAYSDLVENDWEWLGNFHSTPESTINTLILHTMKTVDIVDGLFGFFMDRVQNGFRKTGWDYLNYYIDDVPIF